MGFNWGEWSKEEGNPAQVDVFAEALAKKCAKGQTKYAIDGNRIVIVTRDMGGNVRHFDTKILRFNYTFAENPSLVNTEVEDDFDFEEPAENYED